MSHRIALFPGSFDPFTVGHASLVERALVQFDEVIVAIGVNSEKRGMFSPSQRMEMIRSLYIGEPRVRIEFYTGLTTEFASKVGASCMIRGVRSAVDFDYELQIAETNRMISGIETVFLSPLPQWQHVSSSVVRELLRFGQEVSAFLPSGMKLPVPESSQEDI